MQVDFLKGHPVVFVSGIDTGVGKTVVTGELARAAIAKGRDAITVKMVQTGNIGLSEDIEEHRRIMGVGELPEDAEVKLNDQSYRVVGTVRHAGSVFGGRGVGDAVAYDAYIPLTTAAKKGVAMSSLTLSALPRQSAGAEVMFRQAAELWVPGGQLVNLKKEAMRRTILPRVILLIVGMYAMIGLFKRMTNLAEGWFARFRQALRGQYFKALLPRLMGIIALTLLGYGALIGATYLLLVFSAQPLYVFTEWVPDNIVEWSSLKRVFWNLTSSAAALTRVGTRELRVVEFWGGALRWGIVTALLGVALLPKRIGNREQGTGNRKGS